MKETSAELRITIDDITETLLKLATTSMAAYRVQYLTAASFINNGTIIAWFNNQALHSASLALDLVHNAIIKASFGSDHNIHVTNAPLAFMTKNDSTPSNMPESNDYFGESFTAVIGIIMSVLSASYISYYIKVRMGWYSII